MSMRIHRLQLIAEDLPALVFKRPDQHANEGHSALRATDRLPSPWSVVAERAKPA